MALRAFPPSRNSRVIGCSIDPTQEGLAAMQHFLRSIGSTLPARPTISGMNIANGLQTSLGMQVVSVNGVSPQTHFAQVMVEADYRMKLIGIGLEKPPIRMVSYVDRANPAAGRPQRHEAVVFRPRLRVRAQRRRRHGHGVGRRRRETGRRRRVGQLPRDIGRAPAAATRPARPS